MIKFFFSLLLVSLSATAMASSHTESLRELPVQDSGRVKPFDSFARENLELIYGKSTFEGKPAYEIVMTWLLQPQVWQDKPLIEVKHHLLKRALNLSAELKYISIDNLIKNERLPLVMQELQSKRESKDKLDPYGQAMQRLENQLFAFREIASGRMIRMVPDKESENWKALPDMTAPQQEAFLAVTKAFISGLDPKGPAESQAELEKAIENFKNLAREANPLAYPDSALIHLEVHYNSLHPFMWAWISYLLCVLFMLLLWIFKRAPMLSAAWVFAIVGLALHIYGFSLRSYLTGRPPVSNIYETVIWVSFGAVVFSMIIELVYKWRVSLMAGAAVGAFCLILSDLASAVLDPSLQPLEPVLRSNYWLTIHVLTITISYAAFFLAFGLGDIGLFFYLKDEDKYKDRIDAIVLSLYRAIQIGVALMAPGIILGGIWADYSWGRFWGWDPKETWALIALLGYLAVLHARLAGMLKNFGLVCASIVAFSLVIMSWYGVNFVLGAGLHTYGFGAGGVEYVSGFVAVHLLAVIFVAVVRRDRLKAKKKSA